MLKNMVGRKFSQLLIVEKDANGKGKSRWICRCDCGNTISVISYNLTSGNTKSCGCFKKSGVSHRTHGMRKSSEYIIWYSMIARCNYPSHKSYNDYGGRGIQVCEQWLIFENFFSDMGTRPNGYTIERIDNGGNYCKENCKWATRKEQCNNQRNNIICEYNGETNTLKQLSEKIGFNYSRLYYLLRVKGEPLSKIIATYFAVTK